MSFVASDPYPTPGVVYLFYLAVILVAVVVVERERKGVDSGTADLMGLVGTVAFVAGLMGLAVVG